MEKLGKEGVDMKREVMIASTHDSYLISVLSSVLVQDEYPEILTIVKKSGDLCCTVKNIISLLAELGVEIRLIVYEAEEYKGCKHYGKFREFLIEKMVGDYVMLLDEDNVMSSNCVRVMFKEAEKQPAIPQLVQSKKGEPKFMEYGIRRLLGEEIEENGVMPIYALTMSREKWIEVKEIVKGLFRMEDGAISVYVKPKVVSECKVFLIDLHVDEGTKNLSEVINEYKLLERLIGK